MKLYKITNHKIYNLFMDFLLGFCIIVQDIYDFKIFGTPFYKYVILLLFILASTKIIANKKHIKINITYIVVLLLIYAYTFIISYDKSIIIPSIFFVIEAMTYALYIQTKNNEEDLFKSIFRIIFYSSLLLSILGIIQFASYRLGVSFIYEKMTQRLFFLEEGRITSIYSEPAHLCTILCSGLFLSLYKIFNTDKKRYYVATILLLITSLLSFSIVTYMSLLLFIFLFYFYAFFMNKKKKNIKSVAKKLLPITLLIFFISIATVVCFGEKPLGAASKKTQSLISAEYNSDQINTQPSGAASKKTQSLISAEYNSDQINTQPSEEYNTTIKNELSQNENKNHNNSEQTKISAELSLENIKNQTEDQNQIMYDQLSNQTSFAIKSNLAIALNKMKDGYIFGTGLFTHMNYYDEYMSKIYTKGYIKINYTDACSMFIRIFSELGIVGLVIFVAYIIYAIIICIKKKDIWTLFIIFIFLTQSKRLGEYNWVLNMLSFVLILHSINPIEKFYHPISSDKKFNDQEE